MPALSQVSTVHRERLMEHVDALPVLADQLSEGVWSEVSPSVAAEHEFLVSTLIPHMEAVESGIHRELDRLLSCRLAMEPMSREHEQVRQLIDRLGYFAEKPTMSDGDSVELNRVLVKLYSILKVHLREEAMYIPILERNLDQEQIRALVASMDHAGRVEL